MGTAATMSALVEALGAGAAGPGGYPDSRCAQERDGGGHRTAGRPACLHGIRPSSILTAAAFDNAITLHMALGGSTNAVIQLLALAGRAGLDLSLRRFGKPSTRAPVIVNVRPSGEFIVEQLFHSGGIPAVLNELRPLLHSEAATMTGRSIGRNVRGAKASDAQVIRPLSSSQPGRQYHRPVRQPCTGRRGD
jgi:dihydroxyacid dehydratase/phosphogluconate dehydratase